jgi:hypothetical protein
MEYDRTGDQLRLQLLEIGLLTVCSSHTDELRPSATPDARLKVLADDELGDSAGKASR